MKIFSIKNEKINFFNRPIFCESENEALSLIQNILMSDSDRAMSNLKDDLSLYFLGDFNSSTGLIYGIETLNSASPVLICSLREIFDTIPTEKVKKLATKEDYCNLMHQFNELSAKYNALEEQYRCHRHHRKEILK